LFSGLKEDPCPRKQPLGPLPIICTLERLKNEPTAARRGSQRCPRDCSGVLAVAFFEEAQGLLSRFDCVYSGYITQEDAGGALAGWRWHHSRKCGDCCHVLTVYSGYITQGCPGGALAVAMSLRARCFFFPTHLFKKRLRKILMKHKYVICNDSALLPLYRYRYCYRYCNQSQTFMTYGGPLVPSSFSCPTSALQIGHVGIRVDETGPGLTIFEQPSQRHLCPQGMTA
jgi:hypothetical protein